MERRIWTQTDTGIPYATLVGRVDEAIIRLEQIAEQQTFDWFHIMQVTELLKHALLEAEEQYIEEAGEEPRLTVLPPRRL